MQTVNIEDDTKDQGGYDWDDDRGEQPDQGGVEVGEGVVWSGKIPCQSSCLLAGDIGDCQDDDSEDGRYQANGNVVADEDLTIVVMNTIGIDKSA